VRLTKVGTPVTTSNWHHAQLRDDDGSADSSCHFLRGLDPETNVTLTVTDNNDGLETGTLTGTGLLLDWLDLSGVSTSVPLYCLCIPTYLHHLILELWQEEVDDLVLLDRKRVQVDLLHALDLSSLDETAEFGDWLPFLLVALGTTTTSTSTTTSASTVTTTATVTETTACATSCCSTSVCHCIV
jgi:hypothetical protein